MLVDDSVAIIGSANINDRSMVGTRDSEIGCMIEDSREARKAGMGFVQSLRLSLLKQYLGLADSVRPWAVPQQCPLCVWLVCMSLALLDHRLGVALDSRVPWAGGVTHWNMGLGARGWTRDGEGGRDDKATLYQ
jgi:phosphatidylserine/phosphatidylglycerophosphate/cardiolipin synthase-like enzyme